MRKDLRKITFERTDQIFWVCGQEFESISKWTDSSRLDFVYGEGAKMVETGCIWSQRLQ